LAAIALAAGQGGKDLAKASGSANRLLLRALTVFTGIWSMSLLWSNFQMAAIGRDASR
jgi:hypothetical protein